MSFKDDSITSLTNPLIKSIVKLHDSRERRQKKLCIIEGTRAIKTALTRLTIKNLFCTQSTLDEARLLTAEKNIFCISNDVMKKISTVTTPSGLLAIFDIPAPVRELGPGLVLAQISDPGNMGTLIRTAAACGITTVAVVEGADPWSPKVIQASAGTVALVNISQWDWSALVEAKKKLQLAALIPAKGAGIDTLSPKSTLMVVGNEAHGLPQEWVNECNTRISLPMPGGTESLNAAVAGSIALYMTFVKSNKEG